MVLPLKSGKSICIPEIKKPAESAGEIVSSEVRVTPVNSTPTDTREKSGNTAISKEQERFPFNLPHVFQAFIGQDGKAYVVIEEKGNPYVLAVGCRALDNIIRNRGHNEGLTLKKSEINEINDYLQAHVETSGKSGNVWYRVAPIQGGIEVDTGDNEHTRIQVLPGQVNIVRSGSQTLFYRMSTMRAFHMPAEKGELKRLNKYLNLPHADIMLLTAWVSYTLAHPKTSASKYVVLVLQGDQGSGKTTMSGIVQRLIDPGLIGVQTFPTNQKDLVIAAQHSHVLFYDNMRAIKQFMADTVCIAATGGHITGRQLYTDDGLHTHRLHCAIVFNGIHSFIDQPDLAQRSLPLRLKPIDGSNRKSESGLIEEFQADLPFIFRGLLDLIADILIHLPSVEPVNPERMIDFSRWLAAMEKAQGVPSGVYQSEYSRALNEAMLDSLLDDPLTAAVITFAGNSFNGIWSGTPSDLLDELNRQVGKQQRYSRAWPLNAISLSKRLQSLKGGLMTQGIDVRFSRGKHRNVTITNMEEF